MVSLIGRGKFNQTKKGTVLFLLLPSWLFLYPWEGLLYWTAPIVATVILVSYVVYLRYPISLMDSLPLLMLSIVFLLAATISGGDFYPTKRAAYLMVLVCYFATMLVIFRSNNGACLISALQVVTFILAAKLLWAHYFLGDGINAMTDNKNVIGLIAFLFTTLSVWKFLANGSLMNFVLVIIAILMIIFSTSAKYFLPSMMLSGLVIYRLNKTFLLLSVFGFVFHYLLNPEYYEFLFAQFSIGLSKNQAIFSDQIVIGQSAVSSRMVLAQRSLQIFLDGNILLGQGLEYERNILGTYSHNSFISTLVGSGVIGFIFFCLFLFNIIKKILAQPSGVFKIFYFLLFISVLIILMAQRYYDSPAFILLFAFITAQIKPYFK